MNLNDILFSITKVQFLWIVMQSVNTFFMKRWWARTCIIEVQAARKRGKANNHHKWPCFKRAEDWVLHTNSWVLHTKSLFLYLDFTQINKRKRIKIHNSTHFDTNLSNIHASIVFHSCPSSSKVLYNFYIFKRSSLDFCSKKCSNIIPYIFLSLLLFFRGKALFYNS